MHVFIDANILLNFFHYTKDELDQLHNVFATHNQGAAVVHVTEQLQNEFSRNREVKIKDALRRFNDVKLVPQFPSFMKGYGECKKILEMAKDIQDLLKSVNAKTQIDIADRNLIADKLIGDIFAKSKIVPVTRQIFDDAFMRTTLRNPPGKNGSVGDAVNWRILLDSVPEEEDLHLVSEDGDFYSQLDEHVPHPFLLDEWRAKKKGELYVYRTLGEFMAKNFDGVGFFFDSAKEELIDALGESRSFAQTHSIIGKLSEHSYFSTEEVARILDAAEENGQFGMIVTDYDVSDFLFKHAVPRAGAFTADEHKKIIEKVVQEQKQRQELA